MARTVTTVPGGDDGTAETRQRQLGWRRMVVTLLIVVAATAVRAVIFRGLERGIPYLTYYPAVMFAALYGGLFSGFVATAISAALAFWWIQGGVLSPLETLALAVFILSCVISTYIAEAMHRARAEAEAARDEGRTILRTTMDGYYLVDWAGTFLDTNDAYCEMIGYGRDELLTMAISDIEVVDTDEGVRQRNQQIMATGNSRFETRHRRRDGRVIDIEASVTARNSGLGTLVVFMRDITDRKRAEVEQAALQMQLAQAQKMESVGRLAGGVAHDYNNMLAVIIGHTELGLLKVDATSPLREDLAAIHHAATHSAEITQQLLTFARKQVIRPQLLNLNAAVANAVRMLQPLIGEQVQFIWRPSADLWPITMDTLQVEQVLTNLCLNARDAIGGVGTLVISTANRVMDATACKTLTHAVPGDYALLTVTDSGGGMSRDVLAHLFEPFFTTKGVGEGTGLGLASVYGAVRQNGGFVEVTSIPGEGTTFDIYLPRSAEEIAVPSAPGQASPVLGGHETILVVEDEPAVRLMTTRALEGQGYTVLVADGPREAIRMAQEHEGGIALLLTDVMMPEMSGYALAATLGTTHPRLKPLYMSGHPMPALEGDGQPEDVARFIAKPFALTALTARIRAVLDGE